MSDGGDGEFGPQGDEPVQFHLIIGDHGFPAVDQHGVDSADIEGILPRFYRHVDAVQQHSHADAHQGVQHPVEHEQVGVDIKAVVDGHGEKHHAGKVGGIPFVQQHGGVENRHQHGAGGEINGQLGHVVKHPEKQQKDQSVGRPQQGADGSLLGHFPGGGGIGLNAPQHRQNAVKGNAAANGQQLPDVIDQNTDGCAQ